MPSSALDLLAAHRFFHDLPPTQLETLSASLQSCRFPAGDLPFRSGEQARRCLLLGDGEVQVLRFGLDGEERVLGQFGRGELIAVAALFMADGRYPASARAQTAASGWWLPREALHRLCAAHPALSLRLLQSVSGSLLRSVDLGERLAADSCAQRLAGYLLEQRDVQGSDALRLPLRLGQLAASLGMRSETLSRQLADWRRQGLIAGRGTAVTLLDADALQRLRSAR